MSERRRRRAGHSGALTNVFFSNVPASPPRLLHRRYFSLRHVVKFLMEIDIQAANHSPIVDADYAMRLFVKYRHIHEQPGYLNALQTTLLSSERTPSFSDTTQTVRRRACPARASSACSIDPALSASQLTTTT